MYELHDLNRVGIGTAAAAREAIEAGMAALVGPMQVGQGFGHWFRASDG